MLIGLIANPVPRSRPRPGVRPENIQPAIPQPAAAGSSGPRFGMLGLLKRLIFPEQAAPQPENQEYRQEYTIDEQIAALDRLTNPVSRRKAFAALYSHISEKAPQDAIPALLKLAVNLYNQEAAIPNILSDKLGALIQKADTNAQQLIARELAEIPPEDLPLEDLLKKDDYDKLLLFVKQF